MEMCLKVSFFYYYTNCINILSNIFHFLADSNCVLPINDIRGVESMGYAKGEKLLRCKLAAVFRLLDLYGWTQGVGGQITARLNQDQEHFLVNPYGLLYHEVTASSLIKIDMQGTIVEQGTTNFGVHVAGFQLHSTIHAARPDIKCIVHITTPSVTAVSIKLYLSLFFKYICINNRIFKKIFFFILCPMTDLVTKVRIAANRTREYSNRRSKYASVYWWIF